MKKEENEVYVIPYDGELKFTITDGDYTLREGVDYETYCVDGNEKTVDWLLLMVGMGKYQKMLFCQSKLATATEELIASRGKEIEALLDLIRNKGNDVFY